MMRATTTAAPVAAAPAVRAVLPPSVQTAINEPGQPLETRTREYFESRFSHNFADIRVHRGSGATSSARAVDARAYSVGRDIVLDTEACPAESSRGTRLLAHELAHAVQATRRDPAAAEVAPEDAAAEAEAWSASDAIASGAQAPAIQHAQTAPLLQRVSAGEFFARLFGGGTFSDQELKDYLQFLDVNNRIEDDNDSDNKARVIVGRWKAGATLFELDVRRKTLLIEEMVSGFTGDDDEQAILDLLRGSKDAELAIILRDVGEERLGGEMHGAESDEYERFLRDWRARRTAAGQPDPKASKSKTPPMIDKIVVDQRTVQTVTAHWTDGRTDTDICSTGKGHCCVDPDSPGPTPEQTRVNESGWTPEGSFKVKRKLPQTSSGVRLWTEFVTDRAIALHEYWPVDGTPLSHGCVRMNQPMAQKIYDGSVEHKTRVIVNYTPRPRCDHPYLQREWANDLSTGGSTAPDGDGRTQRQIADVRKNLRAAFGQSDRGVDETIEELRRQTGGLPTNIRDPQARAKTLKALTPLAAAIPRCNVGGP